MVRSQNVYDRHFEREGLAFISDEQAARLRNARIEKGDILLNITGDGVTFGRSAVIPTAILPACVNQHVSIIRLDPKKADPGFVLGFLTHPAVKPYIESFNAGGSRRAITKAHIESFVLPLPPIAEQRAIARVLGALDDKIELNRRMNRTLEEMAAALFRSWFVDFDPVVRRAGGGPTSGNNASVPFQHMDTLFPDSFQDSEIGPIPKGWRVGSIGEIAENQRRITDPRSVEPSTPYIGLEHMPRRSIYLGEWGSAADAASAKSRYLKGEILFGKLRPYFHKVGIALTDGVCSTDVLVVSPKSESWFGLVTGHLSSPEFIDYADTTSGGTRMPRASWGDLKRYGVAFPPESLALRLSAFYIRVAKMFAHNVRESLTLAELRDALLPKLLSGEVRVKADRATVPPEGGKKRGGIVR